MNEKLSSAKRHRPIYPWIILIVSALFNAYSFSLQSSPGIKELIGGSHEKIIHYVYAHSGFFYAFALFQIPIGIVIDRFGSRIFPTIGIVLCALGAILFSQSTNPWQMGASRFIMGAGGAFSFLNALKLISNWFQPKRYAFLVGMFVAMGTLGIVFLKMLFAKLSLVIEWQGAMLSYGIGGLVFACIFFFVVKDIPGSHSTVHGLLEDKKRFWKDVRSVFDNAQIWVIGIAVGLMIGPLFSFEALWSVPFLETVYKVPTNVALLFNFLFVIGYAIGSVFFGHVSTSLGRRKIFIPWGIGFSLLMILIILYPPYMGFQITMISFFTLGFAAGIINLGYVSVHEMNPPHVTASAIAVINTFYAFFAAISQSLIAVYLQLGEKLEYAQSYTAHDYQVSLIRLPVYLLIALIFSFFIKETYCKQVTNNSQSS